MKTILRISRAALGVSLLLALSRFGGDTVQASSWPEAAQLEVRTNLPDPLRMWDGSPVTSPEMWRAQRRPELRALFQQYMYGHLPPAPKCEFKVERVKPDLFGGKATEKEISIRFGPGEGLAIHLLLVVPNRRTQPAPVFVGLNFYGNHTVLEDPWITLPTGWMPAGGPGVTNNRATDTGRGKNSSGWAIEQSVDRGYAVATFYHGDIEPDRPGAAEGIRAQYKDAAGQLYDWGAIAAWAWGVHRVVDYLVTDRNVDAGKIAVFGHSRNGKAAIVAGAFDDRIALVYPHQAGCGGTSPNRGTIGESVQRINTAFPHWFNAEFKKFNEQPARLPFDQHALMALLAPRPVLLSNATEDQWANPSGQFAMLQAAEPVYRLLNAGGLAVKEMPPEGQLVDSVLGFYIRPGKHSTTPEDWRVFLDFADRHWGKVKRGN